MSLERMVAYGIEALFIFGTLAVVLIEDRNRRAAGRRLALRHALNLMCSGIVLAFSVEVFYRHYPTLDAVVTWHRSDAALLVSTVVLVVIAFAPLAVNRARRKAGAPLLPPAVLMLCLVAAVFVATTIRSIVLHLVR